MSKLNLTKIAGGAGVIVIITKYFRRVIDIIALSILVYAITYLLSPYSDIANYLKGHLIIIVAGIVSATFLLASIVGKKKVNGLTSSEADQMAILFGIFMFLFTIWMFWLSRVPTPCIEDSLGQIAVGDHTVKVHISKIEDNTAWYEVCAPENEGQRGLKETNVNQITCYK